MLGSLFDDLQSQLSWLELAVFGGLILFTCITTVSSTSISREGKGFALSLSLPLSGREQIKAKMFFHLLFFYPSFLLNILLVYLLLNLDPIHLLYIIPGGIILMGVTFLGDILFDLKRPLLDWNHPQQAMKQNMNAIAGMGMSLLIIAVFAAFGILLITAGVSAVITGLLIDAAGTALFLLGYPALSAYADKRYLKELELAG
jgi:ABC-2 type transport system permease protein